MNDLSKEIAKSCASLGICGAVIAGIIVTNNLMCLLGLLALLIIF